MTIIINFIFVKDPIFLNVRLQSTTNAETEVKKKKKFRKPRFTKYVELLEG